MEKQKEQQRQQHIEQLAALQSQLETAQNEKFALSEEKGRLALQIEQLKTELEKKSAQLASTAERLEVREKKELQEEKLKQETQVLTEQTSRQLETCENLKSKMRESLMTRLKRMGSEAGVGGAVDKAPATSAYVGSLEKHNKELQSTLQVCVGVYIYIYIYICVHVFVLAFQHARKGIRKKHGPKSFRRSNK